jgi:phytoene synthase
VVQRLLRAADVLYARAEGGIADLPLDCRPAIQSACRVYAEIGHQLEREGLDSVSKRAVVSKGRKIALLAASTGAAFMHSPFGRKPLAPLPEIAYLVDAVQQCEARAAGSGAGTLPRRSFDERMEWATQLHARLIDREQQRAQGRQGRAA